jgi:hypothetical protein
VGVKEGVLFLTYSSLIASSEKGRSRLNQLVQWCGPDFDGLLVFDEVSTLRLTYFLKNLCLLGFYAFYPPSQSVLQPDSQAKLY